MKIFQDNLPSQKQKNKNENKLDEDMILVANLVASASFRHKKKAKKISNLLWGLCCLVVG